MRNPDKDPVSAEVRDAVRSAVEKLAKYERGSGRGQLLALDQIIRQCLRNVPLRGYVEQELVSSLKASSPAAAVEYVCGKLALMGSEVSVPCLEALLDQPGTTDAALAALQAIPGGRAAKTLRARAEQRDRPGQLGAINALGARRDQDSVPALTRLLQSPDAEVRAAATVALGEVGTPAAARSLLATAKIQTNGEMKPPLPDALLHCAELLGNHAPEASTIYQLLEKLPERHVKLAASRGMANLDR